MINKKINFTPTAAPQPSKAMRIFMCDGEATLIDEPSSFIEERLCQNRGVYLSIVRGHSSNQKEDPKYDIKLNVDTLSVYNIKECTKCIELLSEELGCVVYYQIPHNFMFDLHRMNACDVKNKDGVYWKSFDCHSDTASKTEMKELIMGAYHVDDTMMFVFEKLGYVDEQIRQTFECSSSSS